VATLTVTATPTTLDTTGAAELAVTNTGAAAVYVNTQRLRPGQRGTFDTTRPLQVTTQPGETSTVDTAITAATNTGGGSTYIPAVNATDTGYDVVLLLGQSNMQGGDPTAPVPLVDITHPRVFTYARVGTNSGKVVQAADPLQHPATGSNGGVGPGMSFARWYADTAPGNRRVLLVPAAYSGAGFFNGNDAARWNPYADFSSGNTANSLYEGAITQVQAALTAAGPNSRVAAVLWAQGEADINTAATTYRTYLESLIDGLRDRLALPQLPFVIGGMVPEYVTGTNGAINGVHAATPTRKPYTAFAQGPTGYLYTGDTFGLHYTQAGQREQGRRLVAGLAAAKANTAPANAVPATPPVPPANYTPPAGTADYTFASPPTGWTTNPPITLTVSGGNLQVPETTTYQTVAPPNVVDLTTRTVTWRLASPLPAATSGDVFLGVLTDATPSPNPQNAAGATLTFGATPWTDVRVVTGGTRTVDGGSAAAADRAVAQYRLSASGSTITIAYSANGTTWTTLHSGAVSWPLTAVRPFITAGHWDAAQADGMVAVAGLTIT
jgi:hypothetical protein